MIKTQEELDIKIKTLLKDTKIYNYGYKNNKDKGQWGSLIDQYLNEKNNTKKGQDVEGIAEFKSKEYGKENKGEIEICKTGKQNKKFNALQEAYEKAKNIYLFLYEIKFEDITQNIHGIDFTYKNLPYIVVKEVRKYLNLDEEKFRQTINFREKKDYNQIYFSNLKKMEDNYPRILTTTL
jgi:hypothetical protein